MDLPEAHSTEQIERKTKDREIVEKFVKSGPDLLEALRIIASQSIGDDWTADQAIILARQVAREAIRQFK